MITVKFSINELHVHFDGVECVLQKLAVIEATQTLIKEIVMGTKEEVLEAIANEGAEVAATIAELQNKIDELIAAGAGASAADLEEIKLAVQGIFTPAG